MPNDMRKVDGEPHPPWIHHFASVVFSGGLYLANVSRA